MNQPYFRFVDDVDGPIVARRVYEVLFANETECRDPDVILYALNAAVAHLRERGLHPSR